MALEQLYSIKDAAALLGISSWTVTAYLRDRKLIGTKVGSRTLIRESQLNRLLVDGDGVKAPAPPQLAKARAARLAQRQAQPAKPRRPRGK